MSGFLLMFMAFQLRENPIGGLEPEVLTALVVGGAAAGNFLGVVAASVLKRISPAVTVSAVLVADVAVAAFAALFYGVLAIALLGLSPAWARRWRSSPWTRPSSATSRTGCRPARSRAATPPCSWPG